MIDENKQKRELQKKWLRGLPEKVRNELIMEYLREKVKAKLNEAE